MDEYVNARWTNLNRTHVTSLTCQDCPLSGVPNRVAEMLALHLKEHPSHRIIVTEVETTVVRIESDLDADQAAAPVVPTQGEGTE